MGDNGILFALLLFLIIGGGYFAASETAFASVNALRIRQRAENGEGRALRAQYILDHFNKALSTLLIGNNIMHIGTASIATYLVTKLWGEGYTAYSTIATTVVVLAVLFWGWVWGPIGMLLAVPIMVLIKLALVNSRDLSWAATIISDEPPPHVEKLQQHTINK